MTIQIAVKLPEEIVAQVDKLVFSGGFASRSQAVRRGLEMVVDAARSHELDRRYREAFAEQPETPTELAEAERLAAEAINEEPWVPWW